MSNHPHAQYPYFKDTVIKNGTLDGVEILAALKDERLGTQVKKDLEVIKKDADAFNQALKDYKKQYPKHAEADILKDKAYQAKIEEIRQRWNNAFESLADKETFPHGVDIKTADVMPILQQFGAKRPKTR